MSEPFFHFDIECPKCHFLETFADGYAADDWTEVFVFSGCTQKSARTAYVGHTCPACGRETDIDYLFAHQYIHVHNIEAVKAYLTRMLEVVLEKKGLCDHGWDPDVEAAVNRYARLYPQDPELRRLAELYRCALRRTS